MKLLVCAKCGRQWLRGSNPNKCVHCGAISYPVVKELVREASK